MQWVTHLPSSFWIESALVLLATMVCVALVVSRRAPRVLSGPSLHEISSPRLQAVSDRLHALDFRYSATIRCERRRGRWIYLAAFVSSDRFELACVTVPRRKKERPAVEVLSIFEPFGSIVTGNSAHECALSPRGRCSPGRMVARAPWKKRLEDVVDLHRELCASAEECGLFQVSLPHEALDHVLQDELLRDYDLQAAGGTLRRCRNRRYRLTIKGLLLFPFTWASRLRAALVSRRHLSDQQQVAQTRAEIQRCLELPKAVRNRWPERHWTQAETS